MTIVEDDAALDDRTGEALILTRRLGANGSAVLLTLNRPGQLNALDTAAVADLAAALTQAAEDPSTRCVLITGAGRAFCTGGDLKGFTQFQTQADVFTSFVDNFLAVLTLVRQMPKPVVALVNGACVAGGLELVLACDFALAGHSARIGDGHLNYAQVGGAGAMTAMPRAIGAARSKELIYSGRLLSAQEAANWGLVNRVTADDELLEAGVAFANEVAAKSPSATATVKQVIDSGLSTDPATAAAHERATALRFCTSDPDAAEGVLAFSQRRTPVWAQETAATAAGGERA